jgi:hypothetical protein
MNSLIGTILGLAVVAGLIASTSNSHSGSRPRAGGEQSRHTAQPSSVTEHASSPRVIPTTPAPSGGTGSPVDMVDAAIAQGNAAFDQARTAQIQALLDGAEFPSGFSASPFEQRQVVVAESENQLEAMKTALSQFTTRYSQSNGWDSVQVAMANGVYGRQLEEAYTFAHERQTYGDDGALARMGERFRASGEAMEEATQDQEHQHEIDQTFEGNPYQ